MSKADGHIYHADLTNALVEAISERTGRALDLVDKQAVEAYAGQLYRMRRARETLDDEGFIVEGQRGPTQHPAVSVERDASAEMRQWINRRPDLFAPVEEEEKGSDSATGPDSGVGGGDVLDGIL